MQIFRSRSAAAVALAAALSLVATPAFARGGWGHRHHDRIDGGDVLAGLLVTGGIAAIASAASKKNKETREADDVRYQDGRYPDQSYPGDDYRAPDYRSGDDRYIPPAQDRDQERSYGYRSGNLDGTVDSCIDEVERGNRRVDSVETVTREGDGWRVAGRAGGSEFACTVDQGGAIRAVTVDGSAPYN